LLAVAETSATNPLETSVLASGILQFAVLGLLEDGKTTVNLEDGTSVPLWGGAITWEKAGTIDGQVVPTGWSALVLASPPSTPTTPRVRALLVALVSVDEQNLQLLSS